MCTVVFRKVGTLVVMIFQVGTLDVLVGLSDDLGKLDAFCEGYAKLMSMKLQRSKHH